MVAFKQISDTKQQACEDALKIYVEAFPASERHPTQVIKERIDNGKNKLFVGSADGEVAFMAMLWPLEHIDFTLLDYLATKPSHRGKGLASAFLREMFTSFKTEGRYLILEVEDPRSGDNKEERARRLLFFKRNGARELINVRYVLPPLQGDAPTEMILLVSPSYDREMIDAELVKMVVSRIYLEVYSRGRKDYFLNSFIHEIENPIRLV